MSFSLDSKMKLLGSILLSILPLLANFGCSSPYFANRGRDAADIFTFTIGKGGGAKARVGPLQAGLFFNEDFAGLRGGGFGPQSAWKNEKGKLPQDTDLLFFPLFGVYGLDSFHGSILPPGRHKEFEAVSPIPFIYTASTPYYYTQIEVAVGFLATIRAGFNPGELLDFLLGWTTIDIFGDDIGVIESNQSLKQTGRANATSKHF